MEQQRTEAVLSCRTARPVFRSHSLALRKLPGSIASAAWSRKSAAGFAIDRIANASSRFERERWRTGLARIHVDDGPWCTETGPQQQRKMAPRPEI